MEKKHKINFHMDSETVKFARSQMGLQSLSTVARKLILIWANDRELQSRVCALNCDRQEDYERLQENKK